MGAAAGCAALAAVPLWWRRRQQATPLPTPLDSGKLCSEDRDLEGGKATPPGAAAVAAAAAAAGAVAGGVVAGAGLPLQSPPSSQSGSRLASGYCEQGGEAKQSHGSDKLVGSKLLEPCSCMTAPSAAISSCAHCDAPRLASVLLSARPRGAVHGAATAACKACKPRREPPLARSLTHSYSPPPLPHLSPTPRPLLQCLSSGTSDFDGSAKGGSSAFGAQLFEGSSAVRWEDVVVPVDAIELCRGPGGQLVRLGSGAR